MKRNNFSEEIETVHKFSQLIMITERDSHWLEALPQVLWSWENGGIFHMRHFFFSECYWQNEENRFVLISGN